MMAPERKGCKAQRQGRAAWALMERWHFVLGLIDDLALMYETLDA